MPFCLCWANENWTRRWDAAEHEILIAQRYLPDDDLNFIKSLATFFSDPRYIRIDGVPFLIVYRPQHLPDARKTAALWRNYCRSIGIGEIHLCAALTHGNEDYAQFGFDSGVEFPPHNSSCRNVANQIQFYQPFRGYVTKYQEIAQAYLNRKYRHDNVYKSVFPSWDNTPRTGNRGIIVLGGTPDNYEYWLTETIRKTMADFPGQERFVFINAWNEWAEGCHLEPDRKYQRQYLEATSRARNLQSKLQGFSETTLPTPVGAQQRTFFRDLRWVFTYHFSVVIGQLVGWLKKHPRIRQGVKWLFNR